MEETITLLRESAAMLEGHFLLSSGRHSNRYFQCARLLQYPERAAAALLPVAERIKADIKAGTLALDAVVGPALGGIIVAYELGRQLGLPGLFTERDEGGGMALRRGFTLKKGARILMAEDVITTTKSLGECAQALEDVGVVVVAVVCIVDRRQAGVSISWPLYAACQVDVADWEAASCELCTKGVPLVKPGSRKL
ncbi:MAG: orotate phosphoribosyltransferase [Treponema sp.]|jgi:orotate phosphoribosyltransferase|nr:orotate phosphoribosyltransferase [Treponema sp.]